MDFAKRLTVWLSGSGGSGEIRFHYDIIAGKPRPHRSGGAAVRWSRCWADCARRFWIWIGAW